MLRFKPVDLAAPTPAAGFALRTDDYRRTDRDRRDATPPLSIGNARCAGALAGMNWDWALVAILAIFAACIMFQLLRTREE